MGTTRAEPIRCLHELAFATNLAFALVGFIFLFDLPIAHGLFGMDRALYRHWHPLPPDVRRVKDTYTEGYFAYFIAAVGLTFCLWLLLRLFSRTRVTCGILRRVAGIVAFAAAPFWWLCLTYAADRKYGLSPLTVIAFSEAALILIFAASYPFVIFPKHDWLFVLVLAMHSAFWFWRFGFYVYFMGYGGPIAPALGLCACLTWFFYLRSACP